MTWIKDGEYRWVVDGYSFYNSPWIQQAEYGFTVQGKHTPVKGFKGVTKASFIRAKKYAEKQFSKYVKQNSATPKKNIWIKAKAIKFNSNGKCKY